MTATRTRSRGGTNKDVARALGISARTADYRWAYARAWLGRELATKNSKLG